MAVAFKKAERKKTPIKIELFGPPGSGKTWGSLLLATSMDCKNICLIDTEQSASLYSKQFDFNVAEINLSDYKDQQKKFIKDFCDTFISAIKDAEADCIIIDSLTHLWDAVKDYVNTLGGRYTDWAKGSPLWTKIIKLILSSPVPVIICSRASYNDVVEETEKNGKKTYAVKRLGTKADVRAGADYEFTTVLSLGMDHKFRSTKDRTGLFGYTMGEDGEPRELDESIGKEIRAWMNEGETEVTTLEEFDVEETLDEMTEKPKENKTVAKAKAKTKAKEEKPKPKEKKPEWAKETNQYLDFIEAAEDHETLNTLAVSIKDFIAETKDLPKEAADALEQAVTDRIMEIEEKF